MPTDTPPNTRKDIEHTPTISYSITISDDPESSSNLQKEAPTTSRLSPNIHSSLEPARALGLQNPPGWQYRSPETLSPTLSSCPLSPLSQPPSPEPNPSNFPDPLPFEHELNTLTLDRDPDPPLSLTVPNKDGTGVDNTPIPQTPPPPSAHNPPHRALALLQAKSLDPLVEVRLKELRKTLTNLKKTTRSRNAKGEDKN
ncbi:hypothetical protein OPQ81_011015 [Rhizoctonia solani]|nr:hypothetical protein OPQ81_011015 [Rhizoctonia solani]